MVLTKEYRICMPLTVQEYQIGQLYMIARHSLEQSADGEGVEVIENTPCEDELHGKGQYTEKRIHLSSRLPYWLQTVCPRIFYITEKSWNFYPYTKTGDFHFNLLAASNACILLIFTQFLICMRTTNTQEYTCSFVPKLNILIQTKFEDNNGCTENPLNLSEEDLQKRSVENIDIAFDDLSSTKHYKKEEDPKFFQSLKTARGPLIECWRDHDKPIMCSYKLVSAFFEVWGLQTRVEDFIQRTIRDVLLLGHRQAFTWIDEWYDMTMEDVRAYEKQKQQETNDKIKGNNVLPIETAEIANAQEGILTEELKTTITDLVQI